MHRSRVGVVLIDVPEPDHAAARPPTPPTTLIESASPTPLRLRAGGAATGEVPVPEEADDDDARITRLSTGVSLEVQRLGADTPARLHLDIETDDVDAEVARLEILGATRLRQFPGFWPMLDPAGLVFCVVPVD